MLCLLHRVMPVQFAKSSMEVVYTAENVRSNLLWIMTMNQELYADCFVMTVIGPLANSGKILSCLERLQII